MSSSIPKNSETGAGASREGHEYHVAWAAKDFSFLYYRINIYINFKAITASCCEFVVHMNDRNINSADDKAVLSSTSTPAYHLRS